VQVNPVAVVPDESLISLIRQTDEQSDL